MGTYLHEFIRDDGTEALAEYKVTSWGCGPTMPSWNYAGDPGDPMEIDLVAYFDSDGITKIALSDAENERIEREIMENAPEPPNAYDDYDY